MIVAVSLCLLIPASVAAVYYFALTALGWRTVCRELAPPQTRFAILIPAHDEERCLAHTLATIRDSDYPREQIRVLVIADNCTDSTATIAREYGVACLERFDTEHRGKGYALAFGLPHALADSPDAVLILDADCRLDAGALRILANELVRGANVVQAAVKLGDANAGPSGLVMAVGSTIENAVQAGQSRLGLSVRLRGTGMAFRSEVLKEHPWQSFGLTEDAEYGAILERAGVRVRFAPDAMLTNSPPHGVDALCKQRERWRDALFVSGLSLRERLLASKPLILGQLGLTVAFTLAASPWLPVAFVVWACGLVTMTAWVYFRAIVRSGATVNAMANLWQVPGIVLRLARVTLGGFVKRTNKWERTGR